MTVCTVCTSEHRHRIEVGLTHEVPLRVLARPKTANVCLTSMASTCRILLLLRMKLCEQAATFSRGGAKGDLGMGQLGDCG